VLIIVWDTVRADRMSLYGHDRKTTPWVDEWARKAAVYDQAVASSAWTAPTHASLFTGLPLHGHGVDTFHIWLDGHFDTLAEHLGAHGYDTYAFTGNRFVSPFSNMTQGFETIDFSYQGTWKDKAAKATKDKLLPQDQSTEISPGWEAHGHGEGWSKNLTLFKEATPIAHEALGQWLETRDSDKPWFAFLNLMEAHQPRVPSMESRKALLDDEMIELGLKTDGSLFNLMAYTSGKQEYTEAELEAIRGVYDAALLDLDKATGAMLEDLERKGQLDNTIVVLTSDHGELLGEHHMFSHRWALWQELVRVPLVVHYPGGVAATRVTHPVSVARVAPTVTELAGAPKMEHQQLSLRHGPNGPVLSELLDPNPVMKIITTAFPDVPVDQFKRRLAAVMEGELKLIRASDGDHGLYHIATDPEEATNLVADQPEDVARLQGSIDDLRAGVPAYDPKKRAPEDKPVKTKDQSIRAQLKALGYTE